MSRDRFAEEVRKAVEGDVALDRKSRSMSPAGVRRLSETIEWLAFVLVVAAIVMVLSS